MFAREFDLLKTCFRKRKGNKRKKRERGAVRILFCFSIFFSLSCFLSITEKKRGRIFFLKKREKKKEKKCEICYPLNKKKGRKSLPKKKKRRRKKGEEEIMLRLWHVLSIRDSTTLNASNVYTRSTLEGAFVGDENLTANWMVPHVKKI